MYMFILLCIFICIVEEEEAQGAAEFPEEEDVMEIVDNDSEVYRSYSDSVGCPSFRHRFGRLC